MANLRLIRKRIAGVKSTMQVTKAMKMVSAAKLRRAQMRVEGGRPYLRVLTEMIQSAAGSLDLQGFSPIQGENKACIVFSSDRGLCGGYNSNLIRSGEKHYNKNPETKFIFFGKKAVEHFRKRKVPSILNYPDYTKTFSWESAATNIEEIFTACREHNIGHLTAIYSHFVSAGVQRFEEKVLFPIQLSTDENQSTSPMMLIEPGRDAVLRGLVHQYSRFSFYHIVAESIASEYGARMKAMDQATNNAKEMVDNLTLASNRARQTSITTELLEIISGAEALEG